MGDEARGNRDGKKEGYLEASEVKLREGGLHGSGGEVKAKLN